MNALEPLRADDFSSLSLFACPSLSLSLSLSLFLSVSLPLGFGLFSLPSVFYQSRSLTGTSAGKMYSRRYGERVGLSRTANSLHVCFERGRALLFGESQMTRGRNSSQDVS